METVIACPTVHRLVESIPEHWCILDTCVMTVLDGTDVHQTSSSHNDSHNALLHPPDFYYLFSIIVAKMSDIIDGLNTLNTYHSKW